MIFLDCGYHLGEGLSEFTSILGIDSSWEVHAFEPNPACLGSPRSHPFPLTYHPAAVWVENTQVVFRQQHQDSANSPKVGSVDVLDGWGSHVAVTYANHVYEKEVVVDAIDFARFVEKYEPQSVYCKMDIEGAEFAVIPRILERGVVNRFKKLWVEWHPQNVPYQSGKTVDELMTQLQQHTTVESWK